MNSHASFNENARVLVHSSSTAVIQAPIEKVDIPEWVFALTDEEYQQCSIAHIAGGATWTLDGKRISINVELVGPGLMVQHWTENIAEKQRCWLVSVSDMFVQQERVKVQLTWEMTVKRVSETSCEFTDAITVFETDEYLAFVAKSGAPPDQVRDGVQLAVDAHNAEETPNFAKSIERKALSTGR
jgi:hypothetical protein